MRVLTIGTFDLLHRGHLRLLHRAANFGTLTVGVNGDSVVEGWKGRAPRQPLVTRLQQLRALPYVAEAVPNYGMGRGLVRDLTPDLLVVGSDWLDRDYTAQIGMSAAELADLDVSVLFLPRTRGVSSTELREALEARA